MLNYGISGVSVVLLWVFLARMWSLSEFGQFSLIFAWTAIYGLVIELGLDFWATRQGAIDRHKTFSKPLLYFRLYSGVLLGIVFLVVGLYNNYDFFPLMLFLCGAYILNIAHFLCCYLRAIEKLSIEANLSILRNLSYVTMAGLGVYKGFDISWVATCYLGANSLFLLLTWICIRNNGFSVVTASTPIPEILKTTIPVWVSALLLGLSIKMDLIVLGELGNTDMVAHYSAAARIFEGCLLLATAYVLTLFPLLSRQYTERPEHYRDVVKRFGRLLLVLSVFASLVAILAAYWGFIWLFGEEYRQGSRLYMWMMLVFPFSVWLQFLYNALIIAGHSLQVILALVLAAVVNLLLDFWLIPQYHLYGALTAFVVKEMLLLLSLALITNRANFALKPLQGRVTNNPNIGN